jgi:hypothetical protein
MASNQNNNLNDEKALFTVTWEDAEVEVEQINDLIKHHTRPLVLMMGQSMDTGLTLAGLNLPLKRIHMLCHTEFEEALFDLKLKLINTYLLPIDRIRFLQASYPPDQMVTMFLEIEKQMSTKNRCFWLKNMNLILGGIIYQDAWMKLFKQVKYEQMEDKLKKIFNYQHLFKIMDNHESSCDNLSNSIKVSFSAYMKRVYHALIDDHESPYSYLMIRCQYDHVLYPRLFNSNVIDINSIVSSRGSMVDYLLDSVEKYNLITIANLSDIVSNSKELDSLILHVIKLLKPSGRTIFRRRNTDIELYEYINQHMMIINHEYNSTDRTHLYNELIIATPRI